MKAICQCIVLNATHFTEGDGCQSQMAARDATVAPPNKKQPPRRISWQYLNQTFDSMKAGKEFLQQYTHGGLNRLKLWSRMPGGEAQTRTVFKCTAHVDCNVKIRLNGTAGCIKLECNGEEHSEEEKAFDRKNASLTKMEKAEADTAVKYGGSASKIHTEMSLSAVQQGDEETPGKRSGPDAVGVEGMIIIMYHYVSLYHNNISLMCH